MDITERYLQKKEQETSRYLKALTEVYDKIFEYDRANGTVKCLYGQASPVFRWLENVPMQMEEATESWIASTVEERDKEGLRDFFRRFYQGTLQAPDGPPPRITYRALSSSGCCRAYTGMFLKLDGHVSLYCCRQTPEREPASVNPEEQDTLPRGRGGL